MLAVIVTQSVTDSQIWQWLIDSGLEVSASCVQAYTSALTKVHHSLPLPSCSATHNKSLLLRGPHSVCLRPRHARVLQI